MTQGQIINLLDSIMPDIVSSHDPEGVMLKCAKEHNLAPAQLQKLAQVFNTAKTNVFLKQSSNRGDSFTLVDPDSMLSSYVSYKPGEAASSESRKVHNTVDKLMKNADMKLSDWAGKNAEFMLGYGHGNVFMQSSGTTEEALGDASPDAFDVTHVKAASSSDEDMPAWKYEREMSRLQQQEFDAKMDLAEKMASLKTKFRNTHETGAWGEAVEDLVDRFGAEKAASVVGMVEDYFTANRVKYAAVDLSKRQYVRPIVTDRHNMFGDAEEIMGLQEKIAEAVDSMEKLSGRYKKRRLEKTNDHPARETVDHGFGPRKPPAPPFPAGGEPKLNDTVPSNDASPAGAADPAGLLSTPPGSPAPAGADLLPSTDPIAEFAPGGADDTPSDAAAQALLDGMKSPFLSTPKTSVTDMLTGFGDRAKMILGKPEDGQGKIDKAVDNAKRETTINQLMLSDHVLASKDPEEVREMYDLIASHAPMYATEPRLMAPVLAEALQYGSIPVQQMAEILKAQKAALEVKKLQAELGRK